MPPKKAAKKAKKHDHKHSHHHAKDLRRAYEHLGRVQTLQKFSDSTSGDVAKLVRLAQEESTDGEARNVADLLRAAEHLSFAALVDKEEKSGPIADSVEAAITEEFDHFREKAEEHWDGEDADPILVEIYGDTLKAAERASAKGLHRQAMELVRAAEAIAHVKRKHAPKKLAGRGKLRELAAS